MIKHCAFCLNRWYYLVFVSDNEKGYTEMYVNAIVFPVNNRFQTGVMDEHCKLRKAPLLDNMFVTTSVVNIRKGKPRYVSKFVPKGSVRIINIAGRNPCFHVFSSKYKPANP